MIPKPNLLPAAATIATATGMGAGTYTDAGAVTDAVTDAATVPLPDRPAC
jgi:hypothetical protein